MKKNNQDIYLVHYLKRTSKNIEKIADVVYSLATSCHKTYEDFVVENTNIFGIGCHFDLYLFLCHCSS